MQVMGGLCDDDPETTLTAFVHIGPTFVHNALKQAGIHCSSPGVNVEEAIRSTSAYLKRALTKPGRRPYTVAIASYALALDGLPTTLHELLLRGAAPGFSHWLDRENHLFTLEATGYALLALVKWGRMEEAAAPFKWLNSQRRKGGGFGSTQPTMVGGGLCVKHLVRVPDTQTPS
ncbi:complement C3-like isoform X2 [Amphiprion ocellaris]|uniref:complement C3-like isoform X2 n=1 Tax=Amphiprion ocellaris TaxID=80972 RepID=UPI0024113F17|nr:complement C3-like isoform X2 [Amphiprion ocellaris]